MTESSHRRKGRVCRAFATNVRSIFLACEFALPQLVAGGGGSITGETLRIDGGGMTAA